MDKHADKYNPQSARISFPINKLEHQMECIGSRHTVPGNVDGKHLCVSGAWPADNAQSTLYAEVKSGLETLLLFKR